MPETTPIKGLPILHGRVATYSNHKCRCDACVEVKRAYDKSRYEFNKPSIPLYTRKYRLKKLYGMTVAEFEALLEAQGGGCAICGAEESDDTGRRLHVDHDHATGIIRGLLCNACNRGIGYFSDNPDRIRAALAYLERR